MIPRAGRTPTRQITPDLDTVRARRLRIDGQRPMSENLAASIALSKAMHRFAGVARTRG